MSYMRFPQEAQPLQIVHTLILDKECVTWVICLLIYFVRDRCVKIWVNMAIIQASWHQHPWQTDIIMSLNYCYITNDLFIEIAFNMFFCLGSVWENLHWPVRHGWLYQSPWLWKRINWYGFDTLEMVWFWWLGRCWDGMVLSLGTCWDGMVLMTREM